MSESYSLLWSKNATTSCGMHVALRAWRLKKRQVFRVLSIKEFPMQCLTEQSAPPQQGHLSLSRVGPGLRQWIWGLSQHAWRTWQAAAAPCVLHSLPPKYPPIFNTYRCPGNEAESNFSIKNYVLLVAFWKLVNHVTAWESGRMIRRAKYTCTFVR